MSQNSSLIIKNGNCFINGEFKDQDILIENGKIKTIGKVSHLNSSNVYDATGQTVIPELLIPRFILENQGLMMLKI
jgi:dihydroorotase